MGKTIIFDLDGTLTDSGEGIINCATLALQHFGLPIPTREEMRVFVGPPLHKTLMEFGVPEEKTAEAVAVFRSRYTTVGILENTPYPGVAEMLHTLRRQGHRLVVATSKPEQMALRVLDRFELSQYFSVICGATLDSSRVTKEDVIAYLLTQCGPQDAPIMVGDTHYDVEGAAAHGIPTIGVAWGYGKVEDMEKAGAIAIAYTMEELVTLLQA